MIRKIFTIRNFYFILLCVLCGCNNPVLAAEPIKILPATPVFQNPDFNARIFYIIDRETVFSADEHQVYFYKNGSLYSNVDFYRVEIEGKKLWIAPRLLFTGEKNGRAKMELRRDARSAWFGIGFALFAVTLIIGWLYCRRRAPETAMRHRDQWFIIIMVAFLYAWLGFFWFYWTRGQFRYPIDEMAYFAVAKGLMNWDFTIPFSMTIGLPLCYIPWIWLTGAKDIFTLLPFWTYFSALVLMPATFCLFYLMVRKLSGRPAIALAAAALWLLFPRIYLPVEVPTPLSFVNFCWNFSDYSITCYGCILSGFNTMSETVSVPVVFLTAVLLLYCRPSSALTLLVGMIFGFACLIRINNIFFAPLLAWLFWIADRAALAQWRNLLRTSSLAILGFMAVFCWQLAVNYIEFGNPLTLPYVLHGQEVYQGFAWKNIDRVAHYYFNIHHLYYTLLIAGLFLICDRSFRVTLILWTVPLTLFFCGYGFTGQPYRFLLPALFGIAAVIACARIWQLVFWRKCWVVLYVMLLAMPVLPLTLWTGSLYDFLTTGWNGYIGVMLRVRLILLPLLVPLTLWLFRRDRGMMIFLAVWTSLILAASSWVIFFGLVFWLVWALAVAGSDACRYIGDRVKSRNATE